MRPIEFGADIVVHSLTKFLGGHGTTLGGAIVDSGKLPVGGAARALPDVHEPDDSYHGLVYTEHYGEKAFLGRMRSVFQRTMGAVLSPFNAFLLVAGHRDRGAAGRATRRECASASPSSCAPIRASPQ